MTPKESLINIFVGVLKEIDDEFDEAELLTYKASYFKLKCNKENYNWNKR